MTLYVPVYKGYVYDGLSSLDPDQALWLNEKRVFWFRPDLLVLRQHEVRVKTLDSFDFEPDIIKVDVQGTELAVIQGARTTIERSRPALLIEAPSAETTELLRTLGYTPYSYSHGRLHGESFGDPNTLFLTVDRLRQFDSAVH